MSDQNMHTTIRVDTATDTTAIDRLLAKIKALQATVAKTGRNPAEGLNEDLERTVGTVEKVQAAFTRSEASAMTLLNKRFAFERRMNRQQAGEEAEAAKARRLFDSQALAALRQRMQFQSRRAHQQQEEARESARIQADAARQVARCLGFDRGSRFNADPHPNGRSAWFGLGMRAGTGTTGSLWVAIYQTANQTIALRVDAGLRSLV